MPNTAFFQNGPSVTPSQLGFKWRPNAFGSSMPGLSFKHDSLDGYRYGFNGQEKEKELGEYYSFEYRIHDARLGRFLSVDPLYKKFPFYSTYHFASNSPLMAIDIEGLESNAVGVNGNEQAINLGDNNNWNVEREQMSNQTSNPPSFIPNDQGHTSMLKANSNVCVDNINQNTKILTPINLLKIDTKIFTFFDRDIRGNINGLPNNQNCWFLSREQSIATGGNPGYGNNAYLEEDVDFTSLSIAYINNELENGRSVQVGIALDFYKTTTQSVITTKRDGFTQDGNDHFVTITGRNFEDNGRLNFLFVEDAVNKKIAVNDDNKIYFKDGKLMYTSPNWPFFGTGTVIRVQKNIEKK